MKKFLVFLLAILILIYGAYNYIKYIFPLDYSETVASCSSEFNLDEKLVYAVIKAESNFESDAASHKSAIGLMQITNGTGNWCAEKMGMTDYTDDMLKDPETNIKIGTWYLRYLLDELENEDYAIMAYNAGITNVRKWIDSGELTDGGERFLEVPYEETRKYILKVKIYKKVYEKLYGI